MPAVISPFVSAAPQPTPPPHPQAGYILPCSAKPLSDCVVEIRQVCAVAASCCCCSLLCRALPDACTKAHPFPLRRHAATTGVSTSSRTGSTRPEHEGVKAAPLHRCGLAFAAVPR